MASENEPVASNVVPFPLRRREPAAGVTTDTRTADNDTWHGTTVTLQRTDLTTLVDADDNPLDRLAFGQAFLFADWPNPAVPFIAIGVYTIWHGPQLVYTHMAGRGLGIASEVQARRRSQRSPAGLRVQLNQHASGRRGGDTFCVKVADRFLLPRLNKKQLDAIGRGDLSLDKITRQIIRTRLSYRFVECDDYVQATRIATQIRDGALSVGPPLLNPLRRR